jgi:glycosyltransferase involved in cell wall biosynthesis
MTVGLVMPLGEMRGGVERMLMNLLETNRREGGPSYDIAFLEDGPLVASARALGYPARVIPTGRLRDPRAYVAAVRALGQWMDQARLDVVLSWAAKGHLYAGPAARRRGLPIAWYVHGIPDRRWMDRLVTAVPADLILCCSRVAEAAQRRLRPARPTRVVHIAVDLARFDPDSLPEPAEARRLLGLPSDGMLVMMVTRLQRWKGVHVFVAAAARLSVRHPDVHFVVVGGEHSTEPEYRAELEAQAADTGMTDRIQFVGLQSDVPLWMQAADVLVHASFDEPAGAVVLEAMSLGKAVVAARTAGPMEFVVDGVSGRLAGPGATEELTAVIKDLLCDPMQRQRLGAAARERARDFSAELFTETIESAMQGIVQGRNEAAPV